MRDLHFISGKFFDTPIPKDQAYLKKYFRTRTQRAFLKYYLVFGDYSCFVDHTGIFATQSYLQRQEKRLQTLIQVHKEAKACMDLELFWVIESGKYRK